MVDLNFKKPYYFDDIKKLILVTIDKLYQGSADGIDFMKKYHELLRRYSIYENKILDEILKVDK